MTEGIHAHSDGSYSIIGQRAIHLYSLLSLRAALRLYARSGITTRAFKGRDNMLRLAKEQTGQRYAASPAGVELAIINLTTIIEAQEPGQ